MRTFDPWIGSEYCSDSVSRTAPRVSEKGLMWKSCRSVFCIVAVTSLASLTGCTVVSVQPVPDLEALALVCIVKNPKVLVRDFLPVVERRFALHGVETKLVEDMSECQYTLDYTAERSWELALYLDYVVLNLRSDGVLVGTAKYRNRGGLTVTKYAGTASKMNPLIDELLTSKRPD